MATHDQEALFQRWIRNHLGLLIKFVRSFVSTQDDQEDLLQEVFVNLWTSIPRIRGDSNESTGMYRVAIQTAMVWQRGERRRQRHQSKFIIEASIINQSCMDNAQVDGELIEKLYAAIRQLPKLDTSIALMHLDGLSYREIGDVLGIAENYVGVKLSRIRQLLSEQFAD